MSDEWTAALPERYVRYLYGLLFRKSASNATPATRRAAIASFFSDEDNIRAIISSLSDEEYNALLSFSLSLTEELPPHMTKLYDFCTYPSGKGRQPIPGIKSRVKCASGLYEREGRTDIHETVKASLALFRAAVIRPGQRNAFSYIRKLFPQSDEELLKELWKKLVSVLLEDGIISQSGKTDVKRAGELLSLSPVELIYRIEQPSSSLFSYQIAQLRKEAAFPVRLETPPRGRVMMTGDFILYYTPSPQEDMAWKIAVPESIDTVSSYRITKESIRAALDGDYSVSSVISALASEGISSPLLSSRIQSWKEEMDMSSLSLCFYFKTTKQRALMISENPLFAPYIIRCMDDGSFILKKEPSVPQLLRRAGFEMLPPELMGHEAAEEKKERQEYRRLTDDERLTFLERDIPYDPAYRERLSSLTDDEVLRKRIADGTVVCPSQIVKRDEALKPFRVTGLDWQGKLTFLREACGVAFIALRVRSERVEVLPLSVGQESLKCMTREGRITDIPLGSIFFCEELPL